MITKLQFCFLILFPVLVSAQVTQEWVQRYNGIGNGNDFADAMAVDASGNIYVTGSSMENGGNHDYVTIKYDSSGVQQWIQKYNGQGNDGDYASSIAVDAFGNVYVTGAAWGSEGNADYATIKYNSSGDSVWVRIYDGLGNGGDDARSIAVDGSGNVYVTGTSWGNGTNNDITTIKYNSSGDLIWVQTYINFGRDHANALVVDATGNVYVAGAGSVEESHSDYVTICYDSSGVPMWVKVFLGSTGAKSIALDASGNVYVTGTDLYGYFATIKYNSSGDSIWTQRYKGPGSGYDFPSSVIVDALGNVYVTGVSLGSGQNNDFTTIKYKSSGDSVWVRTYNGPGNSYDKASSIAVDASGNVYVTGFSVGSGNYDYATIKYDSSGFQQWLQRYDGQGNDYDVAMSVAVDHSGNVYVTGSSTGNTSDEDYATIKYSQQTVLNSPSQLNSETVDSSFITLTWQDNSEDKEGFFIERTKINDSTSWELIGAVPQNVILYNDYLVTRGLQYYYRVYAYSDTVNSGYSNIDSAVLGGDPSLIPLTPTNLRVEKFRLTSAVLGWDDNSNNETGFIIFRKTEGDMFFKIIDSTVTDVMTYKELALRPGQDYFFKVCSFNQSGISGFSNTVSLNTLKGPKKNQLNKVGNITSENYPNPFNPKTTINYHLTNPGNVTMKIYDVLGKEILVLINDMQEAGEHSVQWDASEYPSGVYFYKLEASDGENTLSTVRRMILIK